MSALRFRPEVVVDLADARAWYEARRPGLGDEFFAAAEGCLARVEAQPRVFAVVHREVRRAMLGRFPYAVFFVVDGDVVEVIAVLHARRAPGHWQTRT